MELAEKNNYYKCFSCVQKARENYKHDEKSNEYVKSPKRTTKDKD